jgi:hypothetical protein
MEIPPSLSSLSTSPSQRRALSQKYATDIEKETVEGTILELYIDGQISITKETTTEQAISAFLSSKSDTAQTSPRPNY